MEAATAPIESFLILETDDTPELATPVQKLSLTVKEFIEDFKQKIPATAASIDLFVFTDKVSIKETDQWTRFTFCPSRINLLDAKHKQIGFISITKLIALYGEGFRIGAYESTWTKLNRTAKVNVLSINLTPKTAKSGTIYYNVNILPIAANNTKAIETLQQYYEATPTCRYTRPTEFTADIDEDVAEIDCGV